MTDAMALAYRMARQGYGWEDIQVKAPQLPKTIIWDILVRVHKLKQELANGRSHDPGDGFQRSQPSPFRVISGASHPQGHRSR